MGKKDRLSERLMLAAKTFDASTSGLSGQDRRPTSRLSSMTGGSIKEGALPGRTRVPADAQARFLSFRRCC